jgi:hypothetical protein
MKHVSASQVRLFQECQRKWFIRYVLKVETPTTPAQQLGTDIHASIEHYERTGEILDNKWKRFVVAVIPFLPKLPADDLLIEHRFTLPTFEGGPWWLGYIDLAYEEKLLHLPEECGDPAVTSQLPVVNDHKTTSDFRYAKTPAEIQDDTQMCSYAKWVQDKQIDFVGAATDVRARLLYIHTRRKKVQVKPVETVLTRERVLAVWERDLDIVRRMVAAEQNEEAEALLPNTATCGKYGGCAYRKLCGLEIITNPGRKAAIDMGNFLDRIKAKQAEKNDEVQTGGNGQTAPGIIPPDGAPRTTPVADAKPAEETPAEKPAETAPEKPKRGRKKMTEAEKKARSAQRMAAKLKAKAEEAQRKAEEAAKAAEVTEPAEEVEAAPTQEPVAEATSAPVITDSSAVGTEGFIIYIDCIPVKGNGAPLVMFDDWVLPVIADINKEIEVADYRLLGFAQEKLALQAGIEKHIGSVPPVLYVSSANSVAKDALNTLIPHARQVIRAVR